MASEPQTGVSDDDLVRRGDGCPKCAAFFAPPPAPKPCAPDDPLEIAFWDFDARRKGYAEWNGAPHSERDAFKATIRALPAASAPVERLALDVCRDLAALLRSEPFPTADVRWAMLQRRAEDAYRAAPATNEAPPALVVPPSAPTAVGSAAERLARAADAVLSNVRAYGFADESWWTELTEALATFRAAPEPAPKEEPAKPDLPWGTDIGPSDYPEPAWKEPAKPEPCRTCGGGGRVCAPNWDMVTESAAFMPCPDCRPGGVA